MSQQLPPPNEWNDIPTMPAPSGQTVDFTNPPSLSPGATAAIVVFLVTAIAILTVRIYTKALIVRRLGSDDYTALLGGMVAVASSILGIYCLNIGTDGLHIWDVPLSRELTPGNARRLVLLPILGDISLFFIKVSITLFLLRVFPRKTSPMLALFLYAALALCVITSVPVIIYTGVVCMPGPNTIGFPAACPSGSVLLKLGVAVASQDVFVDLYLIALAIPAILKLQMNPRRKIGVVAVLSTGILACVISFIVLIYRINSPKIALTAINNNDPTWTSVPAFTLGVIEPLVALTTACLPCMPSFWSDMSPRMRSSLRRLRSRVSGDSRTSSQIPNSASGTHFNATARGLSSSEGVGKQYSTHSDNDFEMGGIRREDRFEILSDQPGATQQQGNRRA